MKKIIVLLLTLSMVLTGCRATDKPETTLSDYSSNTSSEINSSEESPVSSMPDGRESAFTPPQPVISYSDYEPDNMVFTYDKNSDVEVQLLLENFESSGSTYINGAAAEYVINQLKKFNITKKEGPELHNMYWKSGSVEIRTSIGDYCIEHLGDREYRILKLNRKTGKTFILEPTDNEFISNCFSLLHYWPYDKWYGRYSIEENGKLEIMHQYKGVTDVNVKILSIKPTQDDEELPKMVLELTSQKTQAYKLWVYYSPSGDNIDAEAQEASRKIPTVNVKLTKDEPKQIEVYYPGACITEIRIDNTLVELNLDDYSSYAMEKYKLENK